MGENSGSPTVNAHNQIVGQLHSVCNIQVACDNQSARTGKSLTDGKFQVIYNSIASILECPEESSSQGGNPCTDNHTSTSWDG